MASPDGEDWYRYAGPADPRVRARAVLDAYIGAPADAEIEIRGGRDESDVPWMVIRICGVDHGFTCDEARIVAGVAEDVMRGFPHDNPHVWANLILAIRDAADRIEQARSVLTATKT